MFADRTDAGLKLAQILLPYRDEQPIVLALPRGGLPIGYEVASALGAPLDVFLVRKLGAPFQPELAIGAVAEGGLLVLSDEAHQIGVDPAALEPIRAREAAELERRLQLYRGGRPPPDVRGRTVLLVDDGVATGSTMRAAARALRKLGPKRLVIAVPVAAASTLEELRGEADDVVAVETPTELWAIGLWYLDFGQVDDDQVAEWLDRAHEPAAPGPPVPQATEITIESDSVELSGTLVIPAGARSLVLFAHGSGSSRKSPRNRYVAAALQRSGLATLLFDLLTAEEEERDLLTAELRFDIDLLVRRLVGATEWVRAQLPLRPFALGYFGSSTGAAAALVAAAELGDAIGAVVSRGGRPDLACDALPLVRAPTLLIVGGDDRQVLALNRTAIARLRAERDLAVVPGATHLFEEPGALDQVAQLAAEWFTSHLAHPETAAHP